MLFVAPKFFIQKWEKRYKGFELVIDIPSNIKDILNDPDQEVKLSD